MPARMRRSETGGGPERCGGYVGQRTLDGVMPARESRAERARRRSRDTRLTIGNEVRSARLGSGLSQAVASRSVQISRAQWSRIERGAIQSVTLEQLTLACAAVGLDLVVRAYPAADPVRDRAHAALLERFRQRLPHGTRWQTEVPLSRPGDLRAWDAVAALGAQTVAVEAEVRLWDLQALERRVALKQRDGAMALVILLVADTRANRAVLATHREHLRARFPLDSRHVLAALRSGALPPRSGIVAA